MQKLHSQSAVLKYDEEVLVVLKGMYGLCRRMTEWCPGSQSDNTEEQQSGGMGARHSATLLAGGSEVPLGIVTRVRLKNW